MSVTSIHADGHQNQAGGCCCPICGNTCGYHPEYDKPTPPQGYSTLAEYVHAQMKERETEWLKRHQS